MSYCGTSSMQHAVTYNGKTLSVINDDPFKKQKRAMRLYYDPLHSSSVIDLVNADGYNVWRDRERKVQFAPTTVDNETIDSDNVLKSASENEKRVISGDLRKRNQSQTPAEWRMSTVDKTLRRSAEKKTSRDKVNEYRDIFEKMNGRATNRPVTTEKKTNSFPTGPPMPHVMRHYSICPEWQSELRGQKIQRQRKGNTCIVPQ